MADIIDMANDRAEMDLQRALDAAMHTPPPLPFCGQCYNCEASLPFSLRFCDSDCCRDYEKRRRAEQQRGC